MRKVTLALFSVVSVGLLAGCHPHAVKYAEIETHPRYIPNTHTKVIIKSAPAYAGRYYQNKTIVIKEPHHHVKKYNKHQKEHRKEHYNKHYYDQYRAKHLQHKREKEHRKKHQNHSHYQREVREVRPVKKVYIKEKHVVIKDKHRVVHSSKMAPRPVHDKHVKHSKHYKHYKRELERKKQLLKHYKNEGHVKNHKHANPYQTSHNKVNHKSVKKTVTHKTVVHKNGNERYSKQKRVKVIQKQYIKNQNREHYRAAKQSNKQHYNKANKTQEKQHKREKEYRKNHKQEQYERVAYK